ncbi:LysR family transcriptional regulator substrate-binding protein [Streptomyces canus]
MAVVQIGEQAGLSRFPAEGPARDEVGRRVTLRDDVREEPKVSGHQLPIDETGLRVTPLYTEPRVAVLPAGHRLAGKEEVTEADLAGEPLLWQGDPSTQPTRRPHPNAGYRVRGVDETLEHVAAGRGISFLARSASVFSSHPDVTYVLIPDLAPDQVCLATPASRTSPLVDDFLIAAQATAGITAECGNYEMWQLGGEAVAKRS